MNSVVSFVIVLGLLIFIHEFGHFIWAKLFRVKVLKFSLGFGPKIFGRKHGETEYLISALPLGGYVKMLGESPTDEISPDDVARSFSGKPVWQRFLIVAGGPSFNLLFAVFLFFCIYLFAGLPQPAPGTKIGKVTPGSPAEVAGLLEDDSIITVNGEPTETWEKVAELIGNSEGLPVTLTIQRNGVTLEVTGQPEQKEIKNMFGEVVGKRYLLGITRSDEVLYEKVSIGKAFMAGLSQTWGFIYLTIMGVVKIVQKIVPASELGGPILIAQMAGQQMEAGWLNLTYFMGLLSVNLGVLNLFPIPILDGGHLVFFSLEAIRRKPLNIRTQEIWQQIGLVLLVSLMIFVFYNDLLRIFTKS